MNRQIARTRARLAAAPAARAVAATVAGLLLLQGTATASPPVINSLDFKSGALTATWSLPPGVEAVFLEGSLSPKQVSGGGFKELDVLEDLRKDATEITVTKRLDPGSYYFHVVGADQGCDACPTFEYSQIMTVVVTYGFRKDADSTCDAYNADAKRIVNRMQRARTAKGLATAVDDFADLSDTLVADLRDNPPPPAGKIEKRFKAMLRAATRGARLYRRAADALRDGNAGRATRYGVAGDKAFGVASRLATQLKLPACAE